MYLSRKRRTESTGTYFKNATLSSCARTCLRCKTWPRFELSHAKPGFEHIQYFCTNYVHGHSSENMKSSAIFFCKMLKSDIIGRLPDVQGVTSHYWSDADASSRNPVNWFPISKPWAGCAMWNHFPVSQALTQKCTVLSSLVWDLMRFGI